MHREQNRDSAEYIGTWTKETLLYEVGFRLALVCVLGALSGLIFFAGGAFGGSLNLTTALLSSGG